MRKVSLAALGAIAAAAAMTGVSSATDSTGTIVQDTYLSGAQYHHQWAASYTCDDTNHVVNVAFVGDGQNGNDSTDWSGTGTLTPSGDGGGSFTLAVDYGTSYVSNEQGLYDASGAWSATSGYDTNGNVFSLGDPNDYFTGSFSGIPDCGQVTNQKPSQGSPVNTNATTVFHALVTSDNPACIAGRTVHFTIDGVATGTALTDEAGVASFKVANVPAGSYTQSVDVDAVSSSTGAQECAALTSGPTPEIVAAKKK